MIPVQEKPAPARFEDVVAKPGAKFLQSFPKSRSDPWKNGNYWVKVIPDLLSAYDRICAYTAFYIHRVTGAPTVEHFVPKSIEPPKAYDWRNFRLACLGRNAKRGTKKILDPFTILPGTFGIIFPSLEVSEGPLCQNDPELAKLVDSTWRALELNDLECREIRLQYLRRYYEGKIVFELLKAEAPFLAAELERQGYRDKEKLAEVMSFERPYPKVDDSQNSYSPR